jgi:hypothetical protein
MDKVAVVVVKNDVVEDMWLFDSNEEAEKKFLDACSLRIDNWDELTKEDIDECLDNGYAETDYGNGSVCICHPSPLSER